MTAAGVALLVGGGTRHQLFRVAGILIVVGVVLAVVGLLGA